MAGELDRESALNIYLKAAVARQDPDDAAIKPLAGILGKHNARMKCQVDAFADYVAEAEKFGC